MQRPALADASAKRITLPLGELSGGSKHSEGIQAMGLFSKDIKTMDDLFLHTLRDVYYAEKQIVKALPSMIDKAGHEDLKESFTSHLAETRNHVTRLEEVFQMLDTTAKSVPCPAID